MAKKKKNSHIMYHRKWHPQSYSEQARNAIRGKLLGWKMFNYSFYNNFSEVMASACNSYRCDIVKHRMIKGLRRYGKKYGWI